MRARFREARSKRVEPAVLRWPDQKASQRLNWVHRLGFPDDHARLSTFSVDNCTQKDKETANRRRFRTRRRRHLFLAAQVATRSERLESDRQIGCANPPYAIAISLRLERALISPGIGPTMWAASAAQRLIRCVPTSKRKVPKRMRKSPRQREKPNRPLDPLLASRLRAEVASQPCA